MHMAAGTYRLRGVSLPHRHRAWAGTGTGAAARARVPRYITHRPHAALSPNLTPLSASVVEMPVVQGRWLTLA